MSTGRRDTIRRACLTVPVAAAMSPLALAAVAFALLGAAGCASTVTSRLEPSPQAPVCRRGEAAELLWTTRWRTDQKDVPAREAAAAEGLRRFAETSDCFGTLELRRSIPGMASLDAAVAAGLAARATVVVVVVRELGPTLAIGGASALVEGGTEVVLEIAEHRRGSPIPRAFTVRWRDGGPGVVKGVATLPADMQAALTVALQPDRR